MEKLTFGKIAEYTTIFYILACVECFSALFLPFTHTDYKAIQSVLFFFLIIILFKHRLQKNLFTLPFFMIFTSMVLSSYMASTMHEHQPLLDSLRATLPRLMAYSVFFLLCKFTPSNSFTERTILILGFISAVLTIQIWALFPNQYFGETFIHPIRGIRMIVSGDTFKICLLFYCINRLLIKRNFFILIILVVCIVSVILGIVRQVMLITAALGVFFVFNKVSFIKKMLFAFVFLFALQIITTMDFFKNSVNYTEAEIEKDKGGENIRITAFKYYVDQSQVNLLTRIFGNGCFAETSEYGAASLQKQKQNSCFPTDVGLAYFYHVYGIMGIAGLFLIGYRTWKTILPFRYQYLKYSMYYMLLASLASGPILYYQQCIAIPFLCYLIANGKIVPSEKVIQG